MPYNRIREIVLVGEIPVSAAGKVLERELRERLVAGAVDGEPAGGAPLTVRFADR